MTCPRLPFHAARVQATCWCEAHTVWIPVAWVGTRTAHCNTPACRKIEQAWHDKETAA